MIDIKLLRDNPESIKKACASRQAKCDINKIIELDQAKRAKQVKADELRSEKNKATQQIPKLKGDAKEQLLARMKEVDKDADVVEKELKLLEDELTQMLYQVPNLPKEDVKVGQDEKDNEVIKEVGDKPKFNFKPKDYLAIAENLDLIDIKRAAKVAGTRFGYIKGDLALLGSALFQYGKEQLVENGFQLLFPPALIKDEIMKGLGYIEGIDEADKYHLDKDKQYLIATGEHALIPLHAEETLDDSDLPMKYFTYTPCFRREAGSYGKDTKGIFRVHQFDKLEMVALAREGESDQIHEAMLGISEKLISDLGIPYRVIKMVTGDLAFPSARTYDIECFIPSQGKYRETGSISTCTDFQARRLKIRYRDQGGIKFAHTLNGTAYAMGRTLIAIIENYQTKEGYIEVPQVLQKYCNFKIIK
ncbi:MAG: serine--tRNA ligase [Patescibacteria group bacterium]